MPLQQSRLPLPPTLRRDGGIVDAVGSWLTPLAAVIVWLAAFAWIRPLYLPDEGRYSMVAWEMFTSGHWMVPTLDGLPFFHKPPLFYWIATAAMHVLGPTPIAMRVPSILAASATAVAMLVFVRRWGTPRSSHWTVAVLATQPFFFVGAQFANLDMLVAGCISCTVLLAAHAVLLDFAGEPRDRALIGAYVAAALGVLAKGLIGVVLPVLVLLVWLVIMRRPRTVVRLLSGAGLALFAVIVLPWFIYVHLRYPGFLHYFFVYHHVQRFAQGGFNNVAPAWYYPVALVLLALPSSLALPWSARRLRTEATEWPVGRLMWCWLAVIVVFFSIPQSKPVGYVMPVLAPLAWIVTEAALTHRWGERFIVLCIGLAAFAVVASTLGVAITHRHSHETVGTAIRALRLPGEPVIYLNLNPYDVEFYAQLDEPPMIASDWHDVQIPSHDDWRKELFDAGAFAPATASKRLIDPALVPGIVCAHEVSWLVGRAEPVPMGVPGRLQQVAGTVEAVAWRVTRDEQACGVLRALPQPPRYPKRVPG